VLAWTYLFHLAAGMSHMGMPMDMPMEMPMEMAMPQMQSWRIVDLALLFIM
jgi:hypothetical protein